MTRPRKRPILLPILLVTLSVIIAVLTALVVHYSLLRSQQEQVATARLIALSTDSDGAFDPHKVAVVPPQTVQRLLDQGADVNGGTQDWVAPLFRFAQAGNMNVVKLLLAHGADINAQDGRGETALSIAQDRGHTDIVTFLKHAGAK